MLFDIVNVPAFGRGAEPGAPARTVAFHSGSGPASPFFFISPCMATVETRGNVVARCGQQVATEIAKILVKLAFHSAGPMAPG